MIRSIIFDLDNCLAPADEPGRELLAPVFNAVREANDGSVPEAVLREAFEACWFQPFDHVTEVHGFTAAMVSAGWSALAGIEVTTPMHGYGDLDVLGDLPQPLFLVTAGFRRLQASKVRALGIGHFFADIRIDAIEEADRIGKQGHFEDLRRGHGFEPSEMLVVGDSADSELAAAARLGMPAVQMLRSGVHRTEGVHGHVHSLPELRDWLARHGQS